jgi:uncharacterized membrane protein
VNPINAEKLQNERRQGPPPQFASHWWRIIGALGAGAAASSLAAGRVAPPAAGLIGWNAFAATLLGALGFLILTNDAPLVRARAQEQDVNRAVLTTLILAALAASLGAMILTLHDAKTAGKTGLPPWLIALSASTLVLSWMLVHSLFTLHYAHRWFADRDDNGADDGGVCFPGEKPTSYRDFLYMAVCVGATCQVSDFEITTSRFRELVTVHALIAFAFNTMVLALGVNIIGNLMGS